MCTELTVKAPRGLARSFDPAVLIGEWQEDMRSRVEAGEMARNTAVTYGRGMAKFWTWFQGQDTYTSVGPRAIRSWFAHMRATGRKPNGIATHYAGVRAFFAWAWPSGAWPTTHALLSKARGAASATSATP